MAHGLGCGVVPQVVLFVRIVLQIEELALVLAEKVDELPGLAADGGDQVNVQAVAVIATLLGEDVVALRGLAAFERREE